MDILEFVTKEIKYTLRDNYPDAKFSDVEVFDVGHSKEGTFTIETPGYGDFRVEILHTNPKDDDRDWKAKMGARVKFWNHVERRFEEDGA